MFFALALATTLAQRAALQSPLSTQSQARTGRTDDSIAVLRRARSAQTEFERSRRTNLPRTYSPSAGRCDVRIGRFCYWYDEDESESRNDEKPPEPRRIADARDRLLTRLADAGRQIPGDDWIARQRVRYLVEHGRWQDALEVARTCGGDTWWCDALAGLALHTSGVYGAADSAYAHALAAMPDAERCTWSDISMLLSGGQAKRYHDATCADRAALEQRFWALARPLYALDGNDLRTEHYARLTMTRLLRDASTAHGMAWGDDMNELLIRFGWSTRWARTEPRATDPTAINVVGFEPSPAFEFAPTDDPAWNLRNPAAQARYAPRYAKSFSSLRHQLAYFRRGDSAVIAAAFDAREDTLFGADSLYAAVAVLPDSSDSAIVARVARARPLDRARLVTAWKPGVVSVELVDGARHRVGRSRYAITPPSRPRDDKPALSDLLLLEGADSLPPTLDDAVGLARGTDRVHGSERLGVFWEVYGLEARNDTLTYTVTVTPENESWLRRTARRVGLGRRLAPLHMQWEEPVSGGPIVARSLALDLAWLAPGRYWVAVTIDGGATARRPIEVVK